MSLDGLAEGSEFRRQKRGSVVFVRSRKGVTRSAGSRLLTREREGGRKGKEHEKEETDRLQIESKEGKSRRRVSQLLRIQEKGKRNGRDELAMRTRDFGGGREREGKGRNQVSSTFELLNSGPWG